MADPETYVITGYETDFRTNNDSSYYLTYPSEADSSEAPHSERNSLYRSFCEVDLEEAKRITYLIKHQLKVK